MKHRSVSKVRSNKISKKIRKVAKQIANKKYNNNFGTVVWCSKELFISEGATFIRTVNSTYCKAKHDLVHKDGTVTRYVGRNK